MGTAIGDATTLLFDGECRMCRTFARVVSWWGRSRGLRVLSFQQREGRLLLHDFSEEEVQRSAHLVLRDGSVLSGPAAFPALLDRLPALGPIPRRLGDRFLVPRLTRTLYDVALAVRGAVQCAAARPASTA